MKNVLIAVTSVLALGITACKKEIVQSPPAKDTTASTATEIDLLKDSVYLYSKEIYLWHELLPAYEAFNPRQYAGIDALSSATAVMNGIRKLQPLDRFSFVTTKETSEGLQTGADVDYGFFIKAAAADKADPIDSVHWFVSYVFNKSSAGIAGVQRGWYIN